MFGCDKYGIKPDLVSLAKVKHDMKPELIKKHDIHIKSKFYNFELLGRR